MADRSWKLWSQGRLAGAVGFALVFMGWMMASWIRADGTGLGSEGEAADPLVARGYTVTSGAAPGYVDDRVCGSCHTDLFQSYSQVSMSRAFYRPRPEEAIEDFDQGAFFHRSSRRWYQMSVRDGRYVFRRYQVDAGEEPVNVFEQPVDWILGSGSHVRTYLYRTPGGELYQLPIAWYSQTQKWGMAPGYDHRDHDGVVRQVRRECMFCHNAYPDAPAGSDAYDAPQTYPVELPEGLGCQRCHGPGAEHARLGMREPVDFARLASSIVNPANLSPDQRRDICYGCHMLPATAIDSVRRFGRGDFSFRPGEALEDYQVVLDMEEKDKDRAHRFEINHHPYRLEQSRCFIESNVPLEEKGERQAMTCLTCHDPHRKVPEEQRVAHYRAACQSCHEVDACGLEQMVAAAGATDLPAVDPGDCAACHMQKRRPQDAAQVVMTDHYIRRWPGGAELVAPLEEELEPKVVDIMLQHPDRAPPGHLGEVYRATAAVRAGAGADALKWLEESLADAGVTDLDPFLDLARGQLEQGLLEEVTPGVTAILERAPEHPWALEWSAIVRSGDQPREALETLHRAVELHPDRPRLRLQLGRLLIGLGRPAEALPHFRQAITIRPNMVKAHFFLGNAWDALGRFPDAAASYRRALEVEPSHAPAYLALAQTLQAAGDSASALRTLRHGLEVVERPESIQRALTALRSVAPSG